MKKSWLGIILTLCLSLCLTPIAGAVAQIEDEEIVILYTNDVHTYIDGEIRYSDLAALKASYTNVLLVDAGDHIQGTAYGSMDKGESIVALMNATGYDAATLGNHEFDYGMTGCMQAIAWANYPYLSCNFRHEKDGVIGDSVLEAYRVFDMDGVKVALVGITTPETFTSSTPAYFQDEDGNYIYGISGGDDGALLYRAVQSAIDGARKDGAEYVIALGHLGDDATSAPWRSEDVIANTTGLDAFIDGHSHSTVPMKSVTDKNGDTVILTQTGEYFGAVGKLTISGGTIRTELLGKEAFENLQPNEMVQALEQGWIEEIETKLGETIGYSNVKFNNYDEDGNRLVRVQETNSGDFCADALYYLFDNMGMDVDVAIMNGGGVRNKAIEGEITYKTCKAIHTFGNVACLQTVTGQQILDALEWGARDAGTAECGGFLQVSGVTYQIDTSIPDTTQKDEKGVWIGGPSGAYRVHDVMIYNRENGQWEALDTAATYNLAGYNYTLRELGDGYAMFAGAVNVLDYVMEDYMVLANYVKGFANGEIGATNSPLAAKYAGFNVDYGTVNGSGRIEVGVPADKSESMELYIGSTRVTAENAADIMGDGTASYDAATSTLTLNGAKITGSYEYDAGNITVIYADGDLTIHLVGDNRVTAPDAEFSSSAIYVGGNLTILGEGKLTAQAGNAQAVVNDYYYVESIAIIVDETLTVRGATIYAQGGDANAIPAAGYTGKASAFSEGIEILDLNVLDGAEIVAHGAKATAVRAYSSGIGVYGDAVITNGHVTAIAGETNCLIEQTTENTSASSAGFYVDGSLVVLADGKLDAIAGRAIGAVTNSNAIEVYNGTTTIEGVVTGIGGEAIGQRSGIATEGYANSAGIYNVYEIVIRAGGSLTVTGGKVTAESGYSQGIYGYGDVYLYDGTLHAAGAEANTTVRSESIGIGLTDASLYVCDEKAKLSVISGRATGDGKAFSNAFEIYGGDLVIQAGTVEAVSGVWNAPIGDGYTCYVRGRTAEDGTVTGGNVTILAQNGAAHVSLIAENGEAMYAHRSVTLDESLAIRIPAGAAIACQDSNDYYSIVDANGAPASSVSITVAGEAGVTSPDTAEAANAASCSGVAVVILLCGAVVFCAVKRRKATR